MRAAGARKIIYHLWPNRKLPDASLQRICTGTLRRKSVKACKASFSASTCLHLSAPSSRWTAIGQFRACCLKSASTIRGTTVCWLLNPTTTTYLRWAFLLQAQWLHVLTGICHQQRGAQVWKINSTLCTWSLGWSRTKFVVSCSLRSVRMLCSLPRTTQRSNRPSLWPRSDHSQT